jgi:biliverdin reductase
LDLKVGIVGTGFVAKLRAEALHTDPRSHISAIAGHTVEKTALFAQNYDARAFQHWQDLVREPDLDLVVVSTVNRDHAVIAQAGKHVVVEYPLALNVEDGEALIALAERQNKLLHVEHLELLGGVHQAFKQALPRIGQVFYARYATQTPQRSVNDRWTYQPALFGFPFVGALSRLHRLVDGFGAVKTVQGQAQFWPTEMPTYRSCVCSAQLEFANGVFAEVTYAKGEYVWSAERSLVVQGAEGALVFEGDQGKLVQGDHARELEVGVRRGLFAQDTRMVLDHLFDARPLYVTPQESLYSLQIAEAIQHSVKTRQAIDV